MPRGGLPAPTVYKEVVLPLLEMSQGELILWLQRNELLNAHPRCPACKKHRRVHMQQRVQGRKDSNVWYCNKCRKEISIRKGSFFASVRRVSLHDVLNFIWMWCEGYSLKQISALGHFSRKTCSKLNKLCVELIWKSFSPSHLPKLHGTVAVDESLFRKRKANVGRMVRNSRWVFGLKPLRDQGPIFYVVKRRNAATLLPIICFHSSSNVTIVSDEWRAYAGVTARGYNHLTVNHSRNFVNPQTGAHTNDIESAWAAAKVFLRGKTVRSDIDLQKWLNVYMWRKWKADQWPGGAFLCFLNDMRFMVKK